MNGRLLTHAENAHQEKLRLFCFPCAGGSAVGYRAFAADLADRAIVHAVELPGHGLRLQERPLERMPALIDVLFAELSPRFDRPFAFWGHSMGALVAFELARKLRREGGALPVYLFASAHRAPQLPNPDATKHLLPDPQLVAYLEELGGTPPAVAAYPELMELVLPALRSDLTLLNTYRYAEERPLDCPLMALGGTGDRLLQRPLLEPWREQTTKFTLQIFPGDHFYLHSSHAMLMQVLRRALETVCDSC